MRLHALSLHLLLLVPSSLGIDQATSWAENWNQFRGANIDGIVTDGKLPLEWSQEKNVLWKTSLAGLGWSQPVVWGDKLFVTTAESDQQPRPDPKNTGPGFSGFAGFLSGGGLNPPDVKYRWKVICLNATTGSVLWEQTAHEGRPRLQIHANNSYASETPVTDGERLIAYFGMTGVYCYDLTGKLLWSQDLGAYPMQFGWGTGSSPILHDDLVYIQCDNDKSSFLVALNKNTGAEAWRIARDEKSNWSTPCIWKNKLRTELVTAGGGEMRSYNPQTGALLWNMRGSGRTAITPVGDSELLFTDSQNRLTGGSGIVTAIRPGGTGDITPQGNETTSEHVAWSTVVKGYRVASPLLYDGSLYVLENQAGIIHCLDAKTGDERYRKRVPQAAGFTASPLANDGKVFLLDQNGLMTIIETGAELNVVATNDLNEMCWGSPAVTSDTLLIRTADHLYAIGAK
jgi:outer membrane protein assembly factor BamB